jgi:putative RecB family exonuclease
MPVYSHSRLGTFETCPRQYWFAYIEKPDIERPETVEAFLGTRVHDALEELYQRHLRGHTMDRDALLAWYDALWDRKWSDAIRIVNPDLAAEDYRKVGRRCLADYHDRHQPFDADRTLALENLILFNLGGDGRYKIRGFIDRLSQARDGTYRIHDYKTSGHLPTQAQADADRQLALYQIGVQGMWDDVQEVDLVWHYLRFDKEIRSRRTAEQLEALKAACIALIDDIESRGKEEKNFPTHPSRLCDWCDYRELCPATRHHVAVAALPPREFKADDGVRLVDQWTDLRKRIGQLYEQAGALEADEEEVKQALIEFSKQQGLESVAGSTCHATVREKHVVRSPNSGDEDRPAFEAALRKAGLWDDFSKFDWAGFRAAWKGEDAWPAAVREALQPFVNETTEPDIHLKKGGVREE